MTEPQEDSAESFCKDRALLRLCLAISIYSAVSKAVADSMASVSREISSLIDARFDNFKKQFAEENTSSVEAAVKRVMRDLTFSKARGTSSSRVYRVGFGKSRMCETCHQHQRRFQGKGRY